MSDPVRIAMQDGYLLVRLSLIGVALGAAYGLWTMGPA